ncbi:MAG: NAD(P)/FAD-dependent oxidoreductase [Anaerolineae bacterium]|nr:NAD(P)/FAD-dependent oxidoreductase [Anaerolineae bacterium]MBL8106509.1 NAD(P)/FAD-dependent oxidoreductase [Anaerolineales bacterium]MCC7190580.1 NAD(P)/FAD-dependent oxidoreductase [Anaerolineales bacterium]
MKYAIVGSGVSGIAAIEAIRSVDRSGEVVMIGDDPHGFYSRPGLAYYLTGELHDKALYPRTSDEYRQMNFRYVKGRVKGVLREARVLELENQTSIPYDRLLIATGAQALPLEMPGANLEGVFKLDHMEDAKRILKHARRGRMAVVIGGGITALELVEGLLARGMNVHYLLRGDRYWSGVLDEHESKIVEARLQVEGVTLHHHAEVIEVMGKKNRAIGARLLDGRTLKCDMVAYAIGIRPRLELARQAGLAVDRGILVNEFMQTNDPYIFAAGDVAQVYDPVVGRSVLDSLWGPARQQGYAAGLNMAGKTSAYVKASPFNVTRLAGLTTTIIGAVGGGHDEDLVGIARGDSETWRSLPDALVAQSGFDVNHLRLMVGEQRLLGAVVMGDQTLSYPLQKIVSERIDISSIREKLLAADARIGDVVVEFWAGLRN